MITLAQFETGLNRYFLSQQQLVFYNGFYENGEIGDTTSSSRIQNIRISIHPADLIITLQYNELGSCST